MAKNTTSFNIINVINEIATTARNRGIAHLYTEDEYLNGREITINGSSLINFGSCSYLGLEFDERLINAGIDAMRKFGTQYSSSRTYVSIGLYKELEDLLLKMYGTPVVLSTNTSLGHQAVIPLIVEEKDAVIFDQQAHVSMQDTKEKLQHRGVNINILRHNRLDELQNKIDELAPAHNKIWYFIDGVYSMYGDLAPLDEIRTMLDKNVKLHLYVDDAHGMSWAGKNGTGYVFDKLGLHPKMVLTTSLAKGFASAGGVFIFPNEEMYWKVKNWGGPLTYSGPQQPAVIGASVASAKVHLSREINERQIALEERISYCNIKLKEYGLPIIGESQSPIFFIGLGLARVGYNMVRRMADSGIYVNLGIFPAVPENCTGIRFTLTLHHRFEDIDTLVKKLAYHLPLALIEEGRNYTDIFRAFRSIKPYKKGNSGPDAIEHYVGLNSDYIMQYENSIRTIEKEDWNSVHRSNGLFDWEGIRFLEEVFQGNDKREHCWKFHFYIVRNRENKILAATFFTETLTKDDMLNHPSVSREVENQRRSNPYYLTSKTLLMGSLLSEGSHLYLDKSYKSWKKVLMFLLDSIWKQNDLSKSDMLFLRDFDVAETEIQDFFMDQGFLKIDLPSSHSLDISAWTTKAEFLENLPQKKRNRIKKEVLKFEDYFEINYPINPSQEQIQHWMQLYQNVKNKNLAINTFDLPAKFFQNILTDENWDIIELKLKPELDVREERLAVGIGFSYKNNNIYCPVILGLDYKFVEQYNVYRQILFQAILRAKYLDCKKILLGLTAGEEKGKFGAAQSSSVAFIQSKDTYNMSVLNLISYSTT